MKIMAETLYLQGKNTNIVTYARKNTDTTTKDVHKKCNKNIGENTIDNSSVSVTFRGNSSSIVYKKPEIKQKKITQELPMEEKVTNRVSTGEIAKDITLSMIPIYGTVREFQKGNIGWGIFGAITDALTLIPVIGAGAKAIGTAIRGGSAAVKALRVGLTTAEVTSKITTVTVAKQFATGASEGLGKLGKAALRVVDPGIDLIYNSGIYFGRKTENLVTKITSSSAKINNIKEDGNIVNAINKPSVAKNKLKNYSVSTNKPDVSAMLNYAHDLIKKTDYAWHQINKENPLKLFDHEARRKFNREFLSCDISSYSLAEKNNMLKNMEGNFGKRIRGITDFVAEQVGKNSENMRLISTASKYSSVMEDMIFLLRNQSHTIASEISQPLYINSIQDLKKLEINSLSEIGIKRNDLL
ncbi:MAG: hypothetical protein G5701_07295 [Serratia symbiotica]|nr:hypothetical protein [Serratia symbiotica]